MIQLARPYLDRRETEAISVVLESGWIMQGPNVARFEAELAGFCGTAHCVAVSSGTAALHLCLMTLGVDADWTVFIPSFAWPAAANVTRLLGGRVVLLDSEPRTFNLDPAGLASHVREFRAAADKPGLVVPVHQFGVPCDMAAVFRAATDFRLEVIEDSACALGTRFGTLHAGTLARAGILSLHPRKIITTGEGGAVLTGDAAFAEEVRRLRNHGNLEVPGLNYRMTDVQAAMGLVQLAKFSDIKDRRERVIATYRHFLEGRTGFALPEYVTGIEPNAPVSFVLQTFMVLLDADRDRERVIAHMARRGVEARPASVSAHMTPAFAVEYAVPERQLPVAADLHRRGLALPLHAGMSEDDAILSANAFLEAVSR